MIELHIDWDVWMEKQVCFAREIKKVRYMGIFVLRIVSTGKIRMAKR